MNIILFICFILVMILPFAIIALMFRIKKKEGNVKLLILAFVAETILAWYVNSALDFALKDIPNYASRIASGERIEDVFTKQHTENTNHTHKASITDKKVVDEATCLDMGMYSIIEYCDCGQELSNIQETISPLGHDFKKTIVPPTCTEKGWTVNTCARCDDVVQSDFVEPIGHNYQTIVAPPTCAIRGYTIEKCARCNDVIQSDYTEPVDHSYDEGVCKWCGYRDPNYVKQYTAEEIMRILSQSVVSAGETYMSHIGDDSISVFAREQHNCFSINTAVSYNLWGGNVQEVVFNITDLNDIEVLNFKIGGNTGAKGRMSVGIYIDRAIEGDSDYAYDLEASDIPTQASINIGGATSLAFCIINHASQQNRIVFFDFSAEN